MMACEQIMIDIRRCDERKILFCWANVEENPSFTPSPLCLSGFVRKMIYGLHTFVYSVQMDSCKSIKHGNK